MHSRELWDGRRRLRHMDESVLRPFSDGLRQAGLRDWLCGSAAVRRLLALIHRAATVVRGRGSADVSNGPPRPTTAASGQASPSEPPSERRASSMSQAARASMLPRSRMNSRTCSAVRTQSPRLTRYRTCRSQFALLSFR